MSEDHLTTALSRFHNYILDGKIDDYTVQDWIEITKIEAILGLAEQVKKLADCVHRGQFITAEAV